ncbi:MAG: hypothetical protein ABDH32_00065 [Candidatus Caldarchaeales archaeon]
MKFPSMILVVFFIIGLVLGFVSGSLINVYTTTTTLFNPTTIISLEEKTTTSTVTVTITEITNKTNRDRDSSCVVFRTSKDLYKISEEVVLILENDCSYTLTLPNPAPWSIIDVEGGIIYSPLAIQVIIDVKPGGVLVWVWDQKNDLGEYVSAGVYYAKLRTLDAGIHVVGFEIIET